MPRRRLPRDITGLARRRLGRFKSSTLAVALTGLVLMVWAGADPDATQAEQPPDTTVQQSVPEDAPKSPAPAMTSPTPTSRKGVEEIDPAEADPATAVREATTTIRNLLLRAYGLLPKMLIALLILLLAWGLARLTRMLLPRILKSWARGEAVGALAGVLIFLVALGAALSVLVGDVRALVGSVGLAGLALSWALQTPIESFTGWLLNCFQSYYRVGDRIAVGDVFGDVFDIDFLTTTVWEAGGPGKPVQGAQPTGALITFPNSEVLRSNIVNFTRDFPYVWDEVVFGVANESDLGYTAQVFERVARDVVGEAMQQPAGDYQALLRRHHLAFDVAVEPQVFLSLTDAWTNVTVRYLVPVRERRKWSSDLVRSLAHETGKAEHRGKIIASYPRTLVQLVDPPRAERPPRP